MHALKVLEFNKILEKLTSFCQTELGSLQVIKMKPDFHFNEVARLLEITKECTFLLTQGEIPSLKEIKDLRFSIDQAGKGMVLEGEILYGIGIYLRISREFKLYIAPFKTHLLYLKKILDTVIEYPALENRLINSLESNGFVKDEASSVLANIRRSKHEINLKIIERMQIYMSGKIKDYLSEPFYTLRNGCYVLPIKVEHQGKVKGIVHGGSASGQTLYIEPDEVLQMGNKLRELESAEKEEIYKILKNLSNAVGANSNELIFGMEQIGLLDFYFSKARYGLSIKGVQPILNKGTFIKIKEGIHPLLDRNFAVPLDVLVGKQNEVLLLTGPNTGGKTVALKTVGLYVAMTYCGLFLPAGQVEVGEFTQLWADIGDEQSIEQSLSTFSGHLKHWVNILKSIKEGALIIIDEVGAGTDPAEGAALSKALLSEYQKRKAIVMASTHYGELKLFAYTASGFVNAGMEFDLKNLKPTYKLVMGSVGSSYGLKIAQKYGMPNEVTDKAREFLGESHLDLAEVLTRLEVSEKRARSAQGEADRLTARLRQLEIETEARLKRAEEHEQKAKQKALEITERELREIRLAAKDIFDSLKNKGKIDEARSSYKKIQEKGEELKKQLASDPPTSVKDIGIGCQVEIKGMSQLGKVLSIKNEKVVVLLGVMKMTIDRSQIITVSNKVLKEKFKNKGKQPISQGSAEVQLRMLRAEDAIEVLQKSVDDALLGGLSQLRIVHGKGEGILRKITHQFLRKNSHVSHYESAHPNDGGEGITILYFK